MKHLKTIKRLIVPILVFTTCTMVSQQEIVYQNDFNQLSTGQYNEDEIKEALGVNFCKGADEGRVFISEFQHKGNVLKVKYPKGKVKTNDSGMHTKLFWNHYETFEELYFSYNVYIPEDFEFRAGAKLPGLAYQTSERNMSLRLMWRYDGLLEFYNHFETRPTWDDWTASVNWSLLDPYDESGGPQPDQVQLKKGAWNHIEVYHKLNTPGQSNGIMRGWLNGELAIDITDNRDYRQSDEGDIRLNNIYLSTFFGGSSDAFKPTKDQYAYFDDFIISKTRIGYEDNDEDEDEDNDQSISISFKSPSTDITVEEGYDLELEVLASDQEGSIKEIKLFINDNFIRTERFFPYTWGHDRSPNPDEVNGLGNGIYQIKAIATNNQGETAETSFTLTVGNNGVCNFVMPDVKGIPGLDNLYYHNVHIVGSKHPNLLHNFVNFSIKWNPQYNQLSKFSLITNNGFPDWYIDFSKTAQFQLKHAHPEITLKNTGFEGLDDDYWVTFENGEFILKSKNNETFICFSNSPQPPSCMTSKSQQIISITNKNHIKLYPNPASSFIQLQGLVDKNTTVNLIDINGKIIKTEMLDDTKMFGISTVPSGYYFLKIKNEFLLKTIPFIKR